MASNLLQRIFIPTACAEAIAYSSLASAVPPASPQDFRYTVYSNSAAELFWRRSTEGSPISYEITRNGESLTITDAISYFDDTLTPGIEYTYTITAIGINGERSGTQMVVLQTPPSADTIASLQREVSELENDITELQSQLNGGVRAPVSQTGQTASVLFGDDGDYRAGVAWPDPRFTLNANVSDDLNENGECDNNETCNGTVTDNLTGLVWLQNANCFGERSWEDAIAVANNLAGDGTSICGLADGSQLGEWRLPNIKEMLSLIDYGHAFPTPLLAEGHPFTDVQIAGITELPAEYWTSTSTENTASSDGAYSVSLAVGWVNRYVTSSSNFNLFVLPVRGGL